MAAILDLRLPVTSERHEIDFTVFPVSKNVVRALGTVLQSCLGADRDVPFPV